MQPKDDRGEHRPLEPIALGLSDALHYGYQGLGSVADGLRQSLTRRAPGDVVRRAPVGRTGPQQTRRPLKQQAPPATTQARTAEAAPAADPAAGTTQGQQPAGETGTPTASTTPPDSRTAGLLGDLAHLVAEAIDIAGEVAYDLAGVVSGRPVEHDLDGDPDDDHPAEIHAAAKPGEKATTQFTLWNTGSLALRDLTFTATTLRAAGGEIDDAAVTFDPTAVKHVAPGSPVVVTITVDVPAGQPDGLYRGIVQGEPGGAYTILELQVGAAG